MSINCKIMNRLFYQFYKNYNPVLRYQHILKRNRSEITCEKFDDKNYSLNSNKNLPILDHRCKALETNLEEVLKAFCNFKYLRLIKNSIRTNGSIINKNPKLALLIERAKMKALPQDFIDFAMDISVNPRANIGFFEIVLPGGYHFIIQFEDIDNVIKHDLLEIANKNEAILSQGAPRWFHNFEQKAILAINVDKYDLSYRAKIEELTKLDDLMTKNEIDEEGVEYKNVCCEPNALHQVKNNLQNASIEIEEACIGYVPKSLIINASSSFKNKASSLILDLSKIKQIDKVYNNIGLIESN